MKTEKRQVRIEDISCARTRRVAFAATKYKYSDDPLSTWAVMLQYDKKFKRLFADWLRRERNRRRKLKAK